MSNQDQIRREVAEIIGSKIRHAYPPSELVIKSITSQSKPIGEDEQPQAFSADDYDHWVSQALSDLAKKRFHACPDNPALIECPRARLLRIGTEAEREGKPSELFRYLMELTNNGATLPHVSGRVRLTAQKYLNIAIAFKQFAASHQGTNFRDLKCKFRRDREGVGIYVSESTLERALRANDLDWSAYAIDAPRKGTRKKRE
ncbi:hypothetical protein [Pseudoduganella danionis]|uniref:hypothetical protein n=1 Tax=Pseudoduganella danionis TaxID=1890295 RepID=UPI0035AFCFD8